MTGAAVSYAPHICHHNHLYHAITTGYSYINGESPLITLRVDVLDAAPGTGTKEYVPLVPGHARDACRHAYLRFLPRIATTLLRAVPSSTRFTVVKEPRGCITGNFSRYPLRNLQTDMVSTLDSSGSVVLCVHSY
ncbi:MAG: hypothetical protein ACOCW8_02495 [bacterium]